MAVVRVIVVAAVGLYLATAGILTAIQRTILYPASTARALPLPEGAEEVETRTGDGVRLTGWHVPPRTPDRPVFVYFHGNTGNLARAPRLERLRALAADGSGVVAFHHRGYGGSGGSPTEDGLHRDGRAGWLFAARLYGPSRLVAYGESLGTGIATRLAAGADMAALVLEAPFTALTDAAAEHLPWFPVSILMFDHFDSAATIPAVAAPILILHGERDRVIPVAQGRTLAALARGPVRLVTFRDGAHEDLPRHGAIDEVRAFLADAASGRLGAREARVR